MQCILTRNIKIIKLLSILVYTYLLDVGAQELRFPLLVRNKYGVKINDKKQTLSAIEIKIKSRQAH